MTRIKELQVQNLPKKWTRLKLSKWSLRNVSTITCCTERFLSVIKTHVTFEWTEAWVDLKGACSVLLCCGVFSCRVQLPFPLPGSAEAVTICYFGSWAVWRQGAGRYDVGDIDPFLCTHLIYGFAEISTATWEVEVTFWLHLWLIRLIICLLFKLWLTFLVVYMEI